MPMNDDTTHKEDAPTPPQRPRNPRVPVNFAVEIEGRTTEGEPFRARAEIVLISRAGATLATEVAVQPGAMIRLTPPFGEPLDAEVNSVWTSDEDKRQQVGVRLLDPNGWFAE